MTNKQETGQAGENLAKEYILQQGYKVIETNWRYGHLEVDIIAMDNDTIVFVEVKTRGADALCSPLRAVNAAKQRNIIRAANNYVLRHKYGNEVRFDIVSVVRDRQQTSVEHIKDAYSPRW